MRSEDPDMKNNEKGVIYTYIYIYTHIYIQNIYIYILIYIYVYIYIYIVIKTIINHPIRGWFIIVLTRLLKNHLSFPTPDLYCDGLCIQIEAYIDGSDGVFSEIVTRL